MSCSLTSAFNHTATDHLHAVYYTLALLHHHSSSGSYEAALLSASPALQFRDLHEPAGSSSTATAAAMAALPPELQLKMEMRGHMDMHRQMLLRQHDQLQLHGTAAAPTAAEAAAAVAAAAAAAAGAGGSSSSSGDSGGSAAAAAAADGLLAAGAGSDSRRASTAVDSGKASSDVSPNVLSILHRGSCSQLACM
jgi:subtilisin family serine protease